MAKESKASAIDCVDHADPINRAATAGMVALLSANADKWNPDYAFSIGATGSLGRLFDSEGRAVHPKEMARMISGAPSFSGKKRKRVELGVSDSASGDRSYAKALGDALGVRVEGCDGDAYFLSGGAMMCGNRPVYPEAAGGDIGRSAPSGFALGGNFTMMLCARPGESINPTSALSAAVAYGLYRDEIERLEATAAGDSAAAFRLYQYNWIARRDRGTAMQWLTTAADLGHDVARYNLAYEYLESGDAAKMASAGEIMDELVAKRFAGSDLRAYYGG
ncbi:hypothetical protein BWQ93_01740 [Sphingopyxis sp. QXT-31]|uniref:hypothetical protein n=1 Tax=Sphingopyxis sp. QXT-31 TaxID=1357916 RepID=UPI0009796B0B|nr:hypothetical protein [Sphingopyxis sp. QXT-31]APZ97354.1 hypothetical protein BWQ93_01740 [Sphingopyxis sp. QXT-31]